MTSAVVHQTVVVAAAVADDNCVTLDKVFRLFLGVKWGYKRRRERLFGFKFFWPARLRRYLWYLIKGVIYDC